MPEYRIKDWAQLFENHKTRILQRLDFVLLPNKMDGMGYTELVSHEHGAAHFGAWVAMLEIASRQKPRGTLPSLRGNTAAALAKISRLPQQLFVEVIERLLSFEIGWLEEIATVADVNLRGEDPALDPALDPATNRKEGNRREENRTEGPSAAPPSEIGIEGWDELVGVASKAGMSLDPDPASDLCQKSWRSLSFEQRRAAIDGIIARVKCGQYSKIEPQYIHTLENYVRGMKWRESLRPRAGPRLVDGKSAARDEFNRRMARDLERGLIVAKVNTG